MALAFEIVDERLMTVPVTAKKPKENGGTIVQKFKVTFVMLDREEHKALIDKCQSGDATDLDVMRETVRGWTDVVDPATNEPVPWSDDLAQQIHQRLPWLSYAISMAYINAWGTGIEKN